MARRKSIEKSTDDKRPLHYNTQPGNKASFSLADFSDKNLFSELRRRGYTGELRFTTTITL